jgi:hypothetical protein
MFSIVRRIGGERESKLGRSNNSIGRRWKLNTRK